MKCISRTGHIMNSDGFLIGPLPAILTALLAVRAFWILYSRRLNLYGDSYLMLFLASLISAISLRDVNITGPMLICLQFFSCLISLLNAICISKFSDVNVIYKINASRSRTVYLAMTQIVLYAMFTYFILKSGENCGDRCVFWVSLFSSSISFAQIYASIMIGGHFLLTFILFLWIAFSSKFKFGA